MRTRKNSTKNAPSRAWEDYLKAIYKLEKPEPTDKGVQTKELAERMSISQASVTNMLKKLADEGYIQYEPYYGVTLNDSGRSIAMKMIRNHRVLESYLVERLGYSWDEVDEEAETLEHFLSDKLVERMWNDLGQPTHDPHGSPIPNIDGTIERKNLTSLAEVKLDTPVMLERIKNRSPEELRYLASIGMHIGAKIVIKNQAPFNGPLLIEVDDQHFHALDYRMALALFVEDNTDSINH
ncbi:metal-dependent transcriptional regulator [Thiomicrorhabdus sp. 6S2-11]|jgi:DtxR family Mn-dependent transcriptional regulator|uniref:Transcriptional regulator MntR n=1 Tax=Thiomicrorhabdus marina TaxID=2818442 RepID=A0ABS3Q677_9GAMM|nr:metal-dependent transcriptional regulator [Thiomicrorhabdus marina]MBO1927840.1 metal-dependent transcriptional regulator [Thiomicrorhabdus marina]